MVSRFVRHATEHESYNCIPDFHRGTVTMLTNQWRLIPQCDKWLMMKNGQLKTQNVKVSLTGSLLYTKKHAGSPVHSCPRQSCCISLLHHQEQRWGGSSDTHRVMRLHRGAGTHQTPTERRTAGPSCYTQEEKSTWRTIRLFPFHPLKLSSSFLSLQLPILLPLSLFLQYRWKSTPKSSFFLFSHALCVPLSLSLSSWLMQGSRQPSCVIDRRVIHDLAVGATPSVPHLFHSTNACVCSCS